MALALLAGRASEPNVKRAGDSYHKVCEALRGLELCWHLWFAQFGNFLWAQNQSSLEFITSPTLPRPWNPSQALYVWRPYVPRFWREPTKWALEKICPLCSHWRQAGSEYGTMVSTVIGRQEWWTEQDNYDLSGLIFPLLVILNGKQI